MSPYEQSLAERKINRWKRERPPALCVWHSEPHPVKRTEKKYKVFPAGSHVLLAAFYTVTKGTKLSENRTVIKKLSFAPRSRAALSLTIAAQFLRCRGTFFFCYSGAIFERSRSLSIDYSGAKYARSAPKIDLTWKSLFG